METQLPQQFFLLTSLFYVLLEHSITRRRRRPLHFTQTDKCCRPTDGRSQPALIVHTRPSILYLRSTLKGERFHVLRFSCRCSDNKYGGRNCRPKAEKRIRQATIWCRYRPPASEPLLCNVRQLTDLFDFRHFVKFDYVIRVQSIVRPCCK